MDRYKKMFANLKNSSKGAFVPFVTIGDPDPLLSFEIIDHLVLLGVDALELGFAFSDPVADGPVIQQANARALKAGIHIDAGFELIGKIRARYPDIPIGLLVYSNLVFKLGIDKFYERCLFSGVDSFLLADVPVHMSDCFSSKKALSSLQRVFVVPPNADEDKMNLIVSACDAFVYVVSRAGVTGAHLGIQIDETFVAKIKQVSSLPLMLGFGVSKPEDFSLALEAGYQGVICGSKIVSIIEANLNDKDKLFAELKLFVSSMQAVRSF